MPSLIAPRTTGIFNKSTVILIIAVKATIINLGIRNSIKFNNKEPIFANIFAIGSNAAPTFCWTSNKELPSLSTAAW